MGDGERVAALRARHAALEAELAEAVRERDEVAKLIEQSRHGRRGRPARRRPWLALGIAGLAAVVASLLCASSTFPRERPLSRSASAPRTPAPPAVVHHHDVWACGPHEVCGP